eukprot:TRINITY_DN15535_c0_g1_i1.p1 TRINITY_DN15535_c0_g1~~TRINITY_DN15535_c0_g1_i1.p1  ORF type:complete len:404 (+),score=86.66 TRINITY_DN15535_c0_g1_i1:106-1212(+)
MVRCAPRAAGGARTLRGLHRRAARAAALPQRRGAAAAAGAVVPATAVPPARTNGRQHHWFNWHTLDHPTARYWSPNQEFDYRLHETRGTTGVTYEGVFWDRFLSPVMYGGSKYLGIPNKHNVHPMWINERLFARAYWNTNIHLYHWKWFHLNFYYVERRQMPLHTVYTNSFVFTPRWAYNLVLLFTKYPYWHYVDVGLRQKVMLYVNFHVWLVFKFKMYKLARMNGIERGVKQRPTSLGGSHYSKNTAYWEQAGWRRYHMANQEPTDHMVPDDQPSDHRQEGMGMDFKRNYAPLGTLTGPEFAREHISSRPWWWHAYPSMRKRWEGWNPFGHDMKSFGDQTGVPLLNNFAGWEGMARLDRSAVSVQGK